MTASIVSRILLRYLAGLLVSKGLIDSDLGTELFTDPQILDWASVVLGGAAATIAEYWYALARRFGWSK